MQSLIIEIPDAVMGQVRTMIPAAYLDLLARLTGQGVLSSAGTSRIEYNDSGEPEKRLETWGDQAYGLQMEATPIASGYGVHGESADWQFAGLPAGIELKGSHSLDLRGGPHNYLAIFFRCQDPRQEALIRQSFGREIQGLIAYDRAH